MRALSVFLLPLWAVGGLLHVIAFMTGKATAWTGFWLALSIVGVIANAVILLRPSTPEGNKE